MKTIRDPTLCRFMTEKIDKMRRKFGYNFYALRYDTEYEIDYQDDKNGKRTLLIRFKGCDRLNKGISVGLFKDYFWSFFFLPVPIRPYKNCERFYVHWGYLKRYKEQNVRQTIHHHIYQINPQKIIVTGYSLGAALAVLCYEDLLYWHSNKSIDIKCEVGGLPRILFFINKNKFIDRLKNLTVYIHGNDIIPRLPFRIFGFVDCFKPEQVKIFCKDKDRSWFPFVKNCIKDHIIMNSCRTF